MTCTLLPPAGRPCPLGGRCLPPPVSPRAYTCAARWGGQAAGRRAERRVSAKAPRPSVQALIRAHMAGCTSAFCPGSGQPFLPGREAGAPSWWRPSFPSPLLSALRSRGQEEFEAPVAVLQPWPWNLDGPGAASGFLPSRASTLLPPRWGSGSPVPSPPTPVAQASSGSSGVDTAHSLPEVQGSTGLAQPHWCPLRTRLPGCFSCHLS